MNCSQEGWWVKTAMKSGLKRDELAVHFSGAICLKYLLTPKNICNINHYITTQTANPATKDGLSAGCVMTVLSYNKSASLWWFVPMKIAVVCLAVLASVGLTNATNVTNLFPNGDFESGFGGPG